MAIACLNFARKEHPEMNVFYVIIPGGGDYHKIKKLGNIISFGSFKHYIYYLAAYGHASAHVDSGTPNSRVSNFMETHGMLKNKKVFLQHGITKDKISFGYYAVNRADLFICGAKPEYDFCKQEFGFPEGNVIYTGFARFDKLYDFIVNKQILIMPTWRSWLAEAFDENEHMTQEKFCESFYYKKYKELLCNEELVQLARDTGRKIIFYPHFDMQKFIPLFTQYASENVVIASETDFDVQQLLKESEILITDYSSVAFDFAYMGKPVIYYQFDYEDYRKMQHPEGYFSYEKHGFGPVVTEAAEVIEQVASLYNSNFAMQGKYIARRNDFFTYVDRNNCQRIVNAIKEI